MTDLISRSAVLNSIEDWVDDDTGDEFDRGYDFAMRRAMRIIRNAPAIDAVPVVHAGWAGVMWCYRCTNCGAYGPDDGGHKTKFCPDCGARMDGYADG